MSGCKECKMRQDDYMKLCKEYDQLQAENQRLKERLTAVAKWIVDYDGRIANQLIRELKEAAMPQKESE